MVTSDLFKEIAACHSWTFFSNMLQGLNVAVVGVAAVHSTALMACKGKTKEAQAHM